MVVNQMNRAPWCTQPFALALKTMSGTYPAAFVTDGPSGERLLLGFNVGSGGTAYVGSRIPESRFTAVHFTGLVTEWDENVRTSPKGVISLRTQLERDAALTTWTVLHRRLLLLAQHLGGMDREPLLAQAAAIVIADDLLNRGVIAVLSGQALDFESVITRYREMARLVEGSSARYTQLDAIKIRAEVRAETAQGRAEVAAAVNAARAAEAKAEQAHAQARSALQAAAQGLHRKGQHDRNGGGGGQHDRGGGGGGGGGGGSGGDRNKRRDVVVVPDCAKNPSRVYNKVGPCPLHGGGGNRGHKYGDCSCCDADTGAISDYKFTRTSCGSPLTQRAWPRRRAPTQRAWLPARPRTRRACSGQSTWTPRSTQWKKKAKREEKKEKKKKETRRRKKREKNC